MLKPGKNKYSIVFLLAAVAIILVSAISVFHISLRAIFIGAFMARHTIGNVGDPFFAVFSDHTGGGVFVTAIAGVFTIVVGIMTNVAFGIVVAVEDEEVVVGKGGWNPLCGIVAFVTVVLNLLVIFIIRCCMTGSTFVLTIRQEICMIKRGNGFPCLEIVTILTRRRNLLMKCIGGQAMATNTIVDDHFIQQQVVKPTKR